MGDAMVIAGVRARWRCGSTCYRTQASANCRTDARTMSATSNRADYGPGARSDQTAADRSLSGIVRVRVGRRRQ
jgi:hypothetical protein